MSCSFAIPFFEIRKRGGCIDIIEETGLGYRHVLGQFGISAREFSTARVDLICQQLAAQRRGYNDRIATCRVFVWDRNFLNICRQMRCDKRTQIAGSQVWLVAKPDEEFCALGAQRSPARTEKGCPA